MGEIAAAGGADLKRISLVCAARPWPVLVTYFLALFFTLLGFSDLVRHHFSWWFLLIPVVFLAIEIVPIARHNSAVESG